MILFNLGHKGVSKTVSGGRKFGIWVANSSTGAVSHKRDEVRTRIFSLTDTGYIINLLPNEVVLEDIRYQVDDQNQRLITDGKTFSLNISEFSARM